MDKLGEIRVVSFADPALDWQQMAVDYGRDSGKESLAVVKEYAETRDASLVREVPGKRLTWWTLRRIDVDMMEHIMSASGRLRQCSLALQYGLVRVENFVHGGRTHPLIQPEGRRSVGPVEIPHMSDDQMRMFAPQHREEIGGVALDRSFLAEGTEVAYLLPRSFQLILMSKMRQVAAEAVRAAEELRGKVRQAQAQTESDSGSPTDAGAKAPSAPAPPSAETADPGSPPSGGSM